jgi:hypothetical protein
MAGRGGPTFLKRQKEMKRAAKAQAKREAKQARRDNRTESAANPDAVVDEGFFQESVEPDAVPPDEPAKD